MQIEKDGRFLNPIIKNRRLRVSALFRGIRLSRRPLIRRHPTLPPSCQDDATTRASPSLQASPQIRSKVHYSYNIIYPGFWIIEEVQKVQIPARYKFQVREVYTRQKRTETSVWPYTTSTPIECAITGR